MANICSYRIQVKGKKQACYAFYGSIPVLDSKSILNESEDGDDYMIQFEGDCKWDVDMYTHSDEESPVFALSDLPEDCDEAFDFGLDYWDISLRSKSRIFNVDVICNSIDIDEPIYMNTLHYDCGDVFEMAYLDTPEEIRQSDYEDMVCEFVSYQ